MIIICKEKKTKEMFVMSNQWFFTLERIGLYQIYKRSMFKNFTLGNVKVYALGSNFSIQQNLSHQRLFVRVESSFFFSLFSTDQNDRSVFHSDTTITRQCRTFSNKLFRCDYHFIYLLHVSQFVLNDRKGQFSTLVSQHRFYCSF